MNLVVDRDKMVELSTAVEKKAGLGTAELLTIDDMVTNIKGLETGAGSGVTLPDKPKDINFYDYNGVLMYAYTFAEAADLVRLPAGPTHEGLTFQCWNEQSLSFIKKVKVPLNVGAVYTTTDDKTHLHVVVRQDNLTRSYNGCCIKGVMHMNWGDGTPDETYACSQFTDLSVINGGLNVTHTFAKAGEYDITVWGEDCDELLVDTYHLGDSNNSDSGNMQYPCLLIEVNYSSQVKHVGYGSGNYNASSLFGSGSLRRVSIPNSVVGFHMLLGSGNMPIGMFTMVIPPSVEEINGFWYGSSSSIARVIFPRSLKYSTGTSYLYMSNTGISDFVMRFPLFQFADKNGTAQIESINLMNNEGGYIQNAWLILAKGDEQVFSAVLSNISGVPHIHVADELYEACHTVWKSRRSSTNYPTDCMRISMAHGKRVDETTEGITATRNKNGFGIQQQNTSLAGTSETVDTGYLYKVSITPSTYEGTITEVSL